MNDHPDNKPQCGCESSIHQTFSISNGVILAGDWILSFGEDDAHQMLEILFPGKSAPEILIQSERLQYL